MRTRLAGAAVVAVIVAAAVVLLLWRLPVQHWLAIHTGSDNEPGSYYGFWSGFGSDIGEVTLLAAVLGIYHKHNCHTKGCWRIGRHVVEGTPWCNHHHQAARDVAADGPVRGGPGSNPGAAGLPADGLVVPPPAAAERIEIIPLEAKGIGTGKRRRM